jgi:hypothetical protein
MKAVRRLLSRPISTVGTLIAPDRTQQEANQIVTEGLVGHWDAGNPYSYPGTGTTWTDLSGNGFNGTLTNGPTYSADRGGTITTDGTNDEINFGDVCNISNNATLCVMIRIKTLPPNTSTFGTVIVKYQASPVRANYFINVNSNSVQAAYNTTGTWRTLSTLQSTGGIEANKWILLGGTFEQSSTNTITSLWSNGVSFGSGTYVNNIAGNSGPLTLGLVAGIEPLNCEYGAVLIYNRVLSSAEMLQNFNALRGRFSL